jgi:hypothetical protein
MQTAGTNAAPFPTVLNDRRELDLAIFCSGDVPLLAPLATATRPPRRFQLQQEAYKFQSDVVDK